jgi:hypothetical protein
MRMDDNLQTSNVHISADVLSEVKEVCALEGATLDEFIRSAIAEKIAHHNHVEWMKNRKPPDPAKILALRKMLRERPSGPPDPGDELPEGWVTQDLP